MNSLEHRLSATFGLEPALLSQASLARAIGQQMNRLGFKEAESYRQDLEHSPGHLRELVESLLVNETWFFREPDAFAALSRLVNQQWLKRQHRVRLLSVPCSSGEEPASLAISLLEANLPAQAFAVDAMDLSAQVLTEAVTGVYSARSFRQHPPGSCLKYFRPRANGFALEQRVRDQLRFFQGNLLAAELPVSGPYDFIFCRNLLIYLTTDARHTALRALDKLLGAEGCLFVALAEQPIAASYGFVPLALPGASAFRKPSAAGCIDRHGLEKTWPAAAVSASSFPAHDAAQTHAPDTPGSCAGRASLELAQARRLANAGHLEAAAMLCEAHLQRNRTSAAGYYLLGVIREAAGKPNALDCYRRALYLDPHHHPSLLQMVLLAEKNGDQTSARNFRRRATRTKPDLFDA